MPDYEAVFEKAYANVSSRYKEGTLRLLEECTLRSALLFECLDLADTMGIPRFVRYNYSVRGLGNADLVLGDLEVAVELKFESRYRRLLNGKKDDVVCWEEAERDIERIESANGRRKMVTIYLFEAEPPRYFKA